MFPALPTADVSSLVVGVCMQRDKVENRVEFITDWPLLGVRARW
jgi:hypothetical protein